LRQVLLNCLLNAADSMAGGQGRGEITVATGNSTNNQVQPVVSIRIRDNGAGIAEEHLDNVFEPFFTTKEPGQGTGLGLFVCHTIIERLGGSIHIGNHDAGSGGAEVVITLPISEPRPTISS
jgi:two-component system, NtrC family, sensor kinase